MLYTEVCGEKLSRLGFGCMRLPVREDKSVDEGAVEEMVDYAIAHGVNYFDTAWPYHGGMSEIVVGKALSRYPRESWHLADKYPGHQISSSYDPAGIFEQQLKKCGVDYFDFYLLHNVYENSLGTYQDPKWGILDYFKEQKRQGRIRHLGFSTHARPETLEKILDYLGEDMEFCQIQLNYLDWTLQNAKAKVELLGERGLPVWVMEPLRGGKLAALPREQEAILRNMRPDATPAEWSFRFLQTVPQVAVVLSGMSNLEQMKENIATFELDAPLSRSETDTLLTLAEDMKGALPCTRCRYCTEGCPMGLDIPTLIHAWNDFKFNPGSMTVPMQMDALPADKLPMACIGCGACAAICPQSIDIPQAMADFGEALRRAPSWADLCREREEAARRLAQGK